MKKIFHTKNLPWITAIFGLAGLLLRIWLYSRMDSKGLLPQNHIAGILLYVLTGLYFAALVLLLRPLVPIGKYYRLFPAGVVRAAGCAAGAAGILAAAIFLFVGKTGTLVGVLGVLAALSMGYTAFLRLQGRRPGFWLEVVIALFFVAYGVNRCRSWGIEPQFITYFFPLLACVGLMVYAYYMAAATSGGNRKVLVFFGQMALYCCLVSLNEQNWSFYLGMAIWLALDTCSLDCRIKPVAQPPEEAV